MPQSIIHAVVLATAIGLVPLSSGAADERDPGATLRSNSALAVGGVDQVAAVTAIIPKRRLGTFARVFECSGSIMHQSVNGEINSPLPSQKKTPT